MKLAELSLSASSVRIGLSANIRDLADRGSSFRFPTMRDILSTGLVIEREDYRCTDAMSVMRTSLVPEVIYGGNVDCTFDEKQFSVNQSYSPRSIAEGGDQVYLGSVQLVCQKALRKSGLSSSKHLNTKAECKLVLGEPLFSAQSTRMARDIPQMRHDQTLMQHLHYFRLF